ncbi:MAG: circularly permuted type 2 ATP-grasp protein [Janthinobacterium lividum]
MVQRPAFDEIMGSADECRPELAALHRWLDETPAAELGRRQQAAEATFRQLGITFAVYGDADAAERIIPFDIVPRVFLADEWRRLSDGLVQRVDAINAFLQDIYGERRILDEGIVPADLVLGNPQFRPEIAGMRPPHDVWAHICGIDLVRTGPDEFYVLEDNARTPSGVSYMLENREAMIRLCPELFREFRVAAVDSYPDRLLATMKSVAPRGAGYSPTCVLLTPGHYNSAYYEHSFLADSMGIELVEAPDLVVDDDIVWMRTIAGRVRVDVIYRRIDDDYLDPLVFLPHSALGVPGLIAAYAAGNVAIINAPGNGIADDKAIYSYMPEIVRFYSGGEPKLPNVETWRCREPSSLAYVLDNLEQLVVKLVDGSGGYGMLVGPTASHAEIEAFRAALIAEPHRYIAQPTLALSTVPTLADTGLCPRHVDFRPFVLSGANGVEVVPGGLTRVALREGSLVVNSSQGGGTKDSFVLMDAMRQSMSGPGGDMSQVMGGGMNQTMGGMSQTLRPFGAG